FAEHLGRCIYGGLWAEILEDRKFYFPITADYAPYKSLEETDFPVVGASPWKIFGRAEGVTMDRQNPFVGEHSPRVAVGSGIRQLDIKLARGREYVGYAWIKGDAHARISGLQNEAAREGAVLAETAPSPEYVKREFRFTTDDSPPTVLSIDAFGSGSIHVGAVSLMPADNVRGMRADTLRLLKELDAPMYRWPGGNFVSGYEWRDGIGPRDRRPPRKNPAWTGVEHNDVGIDEFLDFCREVGAEPLIAANTGFGDAHSAGAEVEYCNGASDTYGGGLRAKHGRERPYHVKYWCVGNEMWGDWQLGYMQLSQYTLKHNRCAEAMLLADPTIELIGCGELGGRDPRHDPDREYGWSEQMLRECADSMEYISEHFYRGQTPWTEQGKRANVAEHVEAMRAAIREKADGHRAMQDKLGLVGDKRVFIAMDEWNYWHRDYVYGELGCRYDLGDALGVAAGLHEYYRQTDIIRMAHYAQTVNVIGCIKTTHTDAFLATTALPLMIYRKHFGTTPVQVEVQQGDRQLDVVAALTEDGKTLTLGIVNPHDLEVGLSWELDGAPLKASRVEQWTVAGSDPDAYNEVDQPRVRPAASTTALDAVWTAPAYSCTVLRMPTPSSK
ncbi:MAG: hypothetical protein KDA61_03460, partial [Planctomycetales bacterium]|nr:hypothetical protein [Planctomycetales bacterium]